MYQRAVHVSIRTHFWGLLRRITEGVLGRGWIWFWLLKREFYSLVQDTEPPEGQ